MFKGKGTVVEDDSAIAIALRCAKTLRAIVRGARTLTKTRLLLRRRWPIPSDLACHPAMIHRENEFVRELALTLSDESFQQLMATQTLRHEEGGPHQIA